MVNTMNQRKKLKQDLSFYESWKISKRLIIMVISVVKGVCFVYLDKI